MLQIQHIRKEYKTGKLVQKALDDVSLNLRDNEFAKTTAAATAAIIAIVTGFKKFCTSFWFLVFRLSCLKIRKFIGF